MNQTQRKRENQVWADLNCKAPFMVLKAKGMSQPSACSQRHSKPNQKQREEEHRKDRPASSQLRVSLRGLHQRQHLACFSPEVARRGQGLVPHLCCSLNDVIADQLHTHPSFEVLCCKCTLCLDCHLMQQSAWHCTAQKLQEA